MRYDLQSQSYFTVSINFWQAWKKKREEEKRGAEILKIFIFTIYLTQRYDCSHSFIFVFHSLCIGESTFSQKREGAHSFPKFVSKRIKQSEAFSS